MKKKKSTGEYVCWWLIALTWIAAGSMLMLGAEFAHSSLMFGISAISILIVPMLLAFHLPPGMFRSVRDGIPAAKFGLGLFLMLIGSTAIALIHMIVLSNLT